MENGKALKKLKTGEFMLCILCREEGMSLEQCPRKMELGFTRNGRTHMKDNPKHEDRILRRLRRREKQNERYCNDLECHFY